MKILFILFLFFTFNLSAQFSEYGGGGGHSAITGEPDSVFVSVPVKIQDNIYLHKEGSMLYIDALGSTLWFRYNTQKRIGLISNRIDIGINMRPTANNAIDLGLSTLRWRKFFSQKITDDGANVGIGTETFDGTAAGVLAIGNGTAPAAGTANQSYLYAKDVTASSEMHVMDEAGNESLISPHDPKTGEWIFYSKNINTGRILRVEMEELIFDIAKEMSEKTGKKYIYESKPLNGEKE